MSDRLHPLLVVLAALDLGFVHATGAVSTALLAPLWGLTLAAPVLRRLQRHALYRAGWNLGVLVVFGLLVAAIACQRGLATRGGAEGVGRATTSAVVTTLFTLIVVDAGFTVLYDLWGI